MESIRGKHIFIAGASGGIGSATARLLHQSGAELFLAGRYEEKLALLANELGLDASRYFAFDATNPEQVAKAGAQVLAAADGRMDVLINAAGIGIIKPMLQLEPLEFLRSLNINLYAPFLLIKAFLPAMMEAKKGLIINIPGVLGKTPMAGAAAYSASKYGLVGLGKSLREELKRTEIRMTDLYLGGTDTPFWDAIDLRVQKDKFVTEQEAAKAIWFLCQQPASGVVSEMVLQPFNHQAI